MHRAKDWLAPIAVLVALAATGVRNSLLFHGLVETFLVVVYFATFFFSWNTRRFANNYLLFLGILLGAVAPFELLHIFAYKGMGVFTDPSYGGANLATQLWIAGRYFHAMAFVLAPLAFDRDINAEKIFFGAGAVAALVIGAVFQGAFPACYVEGEGLTQFKIWSEYLISGLFATGGLLLWKKRERFERPVFRQMMLVICFMILGELAFTVYTDVYGIINKAGHLLVLIGSFFFYRAIVVTGVRNPFTLLFRDLNEANLKLREALGLRDEFLSVAAHELRTPITALNLQLQYLAKSVDASNSGGKHLTQIESSLRQSKRLAALVDDLLEVSRMKGGLLRYEFADMDLSALAAEVVARLSPEAALKGSALALHADRPVHGQWDRARLDQALTNLITNAIRYGEGKPIDVFVSCESGLGIVAVQDHGIGISEEDRVRIFDKFERLDSKKSREGLGLGLYIVKQIVDAHGATIDVESRPAEGSKFTIKLHVKT